MGNRIVCESKQIILMFSSIIAPPSFILFVQVFCLLVFLLFTYLILTFQA